MGVMDGWSRDSEGRCIGMDVSFRSNFKEPTRKEASLTVSSQVNKAEYHTCILREKVDTFLVLLLLWDSSSGQLCMWINQFTLTMVAVCYTIHRTQNINQFLGPRN